MVGVHVAQVQTYTDCGIHQARIEERVKHDGKHDGRHDGRHDGKTILKEMTT
jgi:hypothetical protein